MFDVQLSVNLLCRSNHRPSHHSKQKGHPRKAEGCPLFFSNFFTYAIVTFTAAGPLDVEGNAGAFIKGFETRSIDAGVMDEYIRTVLLLDETVAFAVIEPFYNSINHCSYLLSNNSQSFRLPECHHDKWNRPLERNRPADQGRAFID